MRGRPEFYSPRRCISQSVPKVSPAVKVRRLRYPSLPVGRWISALGARLPAGVKDRLAVVGRVVSRRRRAVIVGVVILQHAALLLFFAVQPVKPIPVSMMPMAVTLFRMDGPPSPITDVPRPDGGDVADAEEVEAQAVYPTPTPAEPEPPTVSSPQAPEPSAQEPVSVSSATASPSDPPALDVLAMVEQITGTSAASVELSDPATALPTTEQLRATLAARPAGGGGCSIEVLVEETLRGDAAVQTSLALVPRESLSVSHAVQLWDGEWTPIQTTAGVDVSIAIRSAVGAAVEAAPARCRNQPVKGPRFFIVPAGDGSITVLVMGSGDWRWRDLLPPREPLFERLFGTRKR